MLTNELQIPNGGIALTITFALAALAMAFLLLRARKSSQRLRALIDNTSDGIAIEDDFGRIQWANAAYCNMLGYTLDEIQGRNPLEFAPPPDQRPSPEDIAAFRFDPDDPILGQKAIWQNVTKSGKTLWVEIRLSRYSIEGERFYVLVCRDISDRIKQKQALEHAQSRLEELVRKDQLTGISNRQDLETIIDGFLMVGPVGVAQLDLDLFKDINDIHGHAAGDAVLVHLGRVMRNAAPGKAHLCRLGGDEFLIVLPDAKLDELGDLLGRVQRDFGTTYVWDGSTFPIGLSIGATLVSQPEVPADDIIAEADYALYASKASGRGGITFYDEALRRDHSEQKALLADLGAPGVDAELEVLLQPAIDVPTGTVWGVETLLRWRNPKRGLLSPAAFAHHARNAGLLKSMDEQALSLSIAAFHDLAASGARPETLSINISGDLFRAPGFVERLTWTCERWGVAHGHIALDLNEAVFNRDTVHPVSNRITELHRAGFRTILDDFGLGALCLHQIAQMDISGIKLAGHLTDGIATDIRKQAVMRAVISLAGDTGITVIAKGVEHDADSDRLVQLGCHIAQGYLFAHPMSPDVIADWLATPDARTARSRPT